MDVSALDPNFDQTEEAAQFFTVFAEALTVSDTTLAIPARPNLSGL
jgi:hypothetical protein